MACHRQHQSLQRRRRIRSILPSLLILQSVTVLLEKRLVADAFHTGIIPASFHHTTTFHKLAARRTTNYSLLFLAKKKDEEKPNDDENDDEDDAAVPLGDADWRAFRAKLVMGESTKKSSSSSSSKSTTATSSSPDDPTSSAGSTSAESDGSSNTDDNMDLDGIGSIFDDEFVLDTTSPPSSTPSDSSSAGTTSNPIDSAASSFSQQEGQPAMTPLDPSQWAYDSGDIIEQGAVILGGVEQEFGFGLRQQYFHKAAILVLDHDPNTFTKGIILNRPTDLMLQDDMNPGQQWRVWFGGDVEGLQGRHDATPDIVCLHSLQNKMAVEASIPVLKTEIQWTTFHNAKKLVQAGVAEPNDFWVFVGYAGWGPRQLNAELERNSWYMVATDSGTLLKELARQYQGSEPRDAGLETWNLLMNMIGRRETANKFGGGFDDHMLKEWAFSNLLSTAAGGGGGRQYRNPQDFSNNMAPELVDKLFKGSDEEGISPMVEGALMRASSEDRSPFLLESQEMHKAVVLILKDDPAASIGVILNRPSTKGLDIKVADASSGGAKIVTIPMRFGGQYTVKTTSSNDASSRDLPQESLLWLHNSAELRRRKIGSPVGTLQAQGLWKCAAQDVVQAISQGAASPTDFLVISGVSIWGKDPSRAKNGIEGELDLGKFERISSTTTNTLSTRDLVWAQLLRQQDVLTRQNFHDALRIAEEAWVAAGGANASGKSDGNPSGFFGAPPSIPLIGGLGEGFDEDDSDTYVFQTDKRVASLSDEALKSWCATFLLGLPSA